MFGPKERKKFNHSERHSQDPRKRLLAVNNCCKALYLRCLRGSYLRLSIPLLIKTRVNRYVNHSAVNLQSFTKYLRLTPVFM